MDWDDLHHFLCVARRGTLSAAARELGVTQPTVGRRVRALEQKLGAKLLVRRGTALSLSAAGAKLVPLAERMEAEALAAERQLGGIDEGMSGLVRVTASEWLVTSVLAPMVAPLLRKQPGLIVELIADTRHLNLARREADLALRPRRFSQDDVVQRAAAKLGFALYASPSYLERSPARAKAGRRPLIVDGGAAHSLIAMSDDVGDVARDWLRHVLPRARRCAVSNGRDAMQALASAGAGIACLARVAGDADPRLVRLELPPLAPPPPTTTLWLGVHREVHGTPRVRVVARFLAAQLGRAGRSLCP